MPLAEELKKIIRGEVLDDAKTLDAYSRDASLFRVVPQVVVRPLDAADVSALVKYVAAKKAQNHKLDLHITPRAAGTDMSGGPLNTSIILDVTAHLNKLQELGADFAVVESGMFFRDFDKQTKTKGLELPSYTASRELNTVGGMVGNNSGGEKNLKYGKTARYVEELEMVLSDGQAYTLKNLEGAALAQKLEEPGFEGDLYRRMSALVLTPAYAKIIEDNKPKVEKNSSGYALWDIGDGKSSLNLARLIVGSQGTLGVVTKIKFKLVHPKPYSSMAVIFVSDLAQLGELVPEVLRYSPDSFESYDDHTFSIAIKYLPELAAQMKSGLIGIGLSFLPELWMALTGGIPKLVLLVEFRGDTQEEALNQAQKLAAEVVHNKSRVSVRVAKTESAARKYWAVRRESFNLLRKKIRGKRTAPFIDDFVVPPATLPEFLPKLQVLMAQYPQLTYTIAGHVGDGNFHIIPLIDPNDPTIGRVIDELSHKVYDLVLSYHGSITGEHNDGLVRTPYVEKMFGREMYALFLEVKKIFDPHDIFNPGKKVGLTYSQALAKLDLPGAPSPKQ
ncbi:MAG TPA: FAD-binding oxidoreductase [Candidatus Paceibacterota bacterium]|nr:FAD-binding oxidoreductase [Candidatus Paceibacterota bacterium]